MACGAFQSLVTNVQNHFMMCRVSQNLYAPLSILNYTLAPLSILYQIQARQKLRILVPNSGGLKKLF